MRTYYYFLLKLAIIRLGDKDSTKNAWTCRFKGHTFIYNELSQASTIMILAFGKVFEINCELIFIKSAVKARTLKNFYNLLTK